MVRVALLFLALLAFATPALAREREHLPAINPMTDKPFSPKSIADYEAEMDRIEHEEEVARRVSEEAEKRWEEARIRNADQIKKFDDDVEAWRKANPPPAGTKQSLISTSTDGETALPEGARITYFNRWNVPTHTVEFGPDGQPTGPVKQTQQGKAWETIGPQIPPGGGVAISYDRDFDGNEIIRYVRVFDKDGWIVARYDFNFDGIAWRGETFDWETGARKGGFEDDRLKPPKAELGGPLDVPATARSVTGVCEPCRPLADQLNDVAARMNILISEMASLSDEHQHAYPPAQKPIEARYAVLKAQLADLTPQYEDLLARVKACGCPKTEAPPALTDGPAPPAGPPRLPPPPLDRPQFERVEFMVPPSFCSEEERVAFMDKTYAPATAAALANATTAQKHQGELIDLFVKYRDAKSEYLPAIEAERDAYARIAEQAVADSTVLNARYDQLLAMPIKPCGQPETPQTTPPPVTDGPQTPPADKPKDPCPPKPKDRPGRKPIEVGPNAKAGSGARTREKVGGALTGALLGAAGLGGGGGGSDGPELVTCRIKDSEMTLFDDPETGTSLRVGAKRAKDTVVVFAEVARSKDFGTFQTAFLENPAGDVQTPREAGICGLWGEWKLTVSWTKTTYVDGQVVSREEGGWSKSGTFSIPGVVSKANAPTGLWKQLGFSNASHGAKEIALQFNLPAAAMAGGPMTVIIHVTRPGQDPVTTVPFILAMREQNGVFSFEDIGDQEEEQQDDCPPTVSKVGDVPPPTPDPPAPPPTDALPQSDPSRPRTTLDEANAERDRLAERTYDEWLADDLKTLDQLNKPHSCPVGVREAWLERLRERLQEPKNDDDRLIWNRAMALDNDRTDQLIDWLSEDPAACRPPGAPPKQPLLPADFAPAPYTTPSEGKPDDTPL